MRVKSLTVATDDDDANPERSLGLSANRQTTGIAVGKGGIAKKVGTPAKNSDPVGDKENVAPKALADLNRRKSLIPLRTR